MPVSRQPAISRTFRIIEKLEKCNENDPRSVGLFRRNLLLARDLEQHAESLCNSLHGLDLLLPDVGSELVSVGSTYFSTAAAIQSGRQAANPKSPMQLDLQPKNTL